MVIDITDVFNTKNQCLEYRIPILPIEYKFRNYLYVIFTSSHARDLVRVELQVI